MSKPVYRRSQTYVRRVRQLLEAPEGPEAQAVLTQLTAKERDCLSRYYIGGKTVNEIGKALGRNASTVSRNIARGSEKLDRAWRLSL